MEDVLNEEFDVDPDAKIEDLTPQPASAGDIPDDTASPVPPEGLHFSFPSEEELPPASANASAVPDAYLPVYNGQPVRVDAGDVERVTTLLREGMRFEQFKPQFDALKRICVAAGYQRPEDLVDGLSQAMDATAYEALLDETGGNEALAHEVMEGRRLALSVAQQRADEARVSPAENRATRLAAEFSELMELCPDAPSFGELPQTVVESAALGERSLADAYLRFMQQEKLREIDAAKAASSAAAASTGSLSASVPDDDSSRESRSFRSGFMQAL